MRKIFLLLFISLSLAGCSNDTDQNNLDCKICDDITSSGAILEICDNGDKTAIISVTLSGIDVYNNVIEIENYDNFDNLNCDDFKDLENFEDLDNLKL